PTDWDEVQEEEGWWDAALPEATPEEKKKEALANAEVAERSLKAEEIYTVASLGGEVTDEMFGKDLSGSIIANAGGAVCFVAAIPFIPVVLGVAAGSSSLDGSASIYGATPTLIDAIYKPQIFAIAILFGSLVGLGNFRKRAQSLKRGKADFIASQEDT
ncbi:MAG: hypothetical protein VYA52_00640, partial [Candidatus Thermoplasmatota archaeon]|nr:hypothetical protein [Candidatus Thermoplasmatota archaeon]